MMKNYLLLLSCIALFSCSNEAPEMPREVSMKEKLAKIKSEPVCTTIAPIDSIKQTGRVSHKGLYWKRGQTIRFKFLNGHIFLYERVKKYANEWTKYANLKFQWVGPNEDADIKITFGWRGDGSQWSKVGTDAKKVPQNEPSMNLGFLSRNTYDEIFSNAVLHEFGHALGFDHEHQNPLVSFEWDLEFAYYYYQDVAGWDKQTVDSQIINRFSVYEVDYDTFDEKSIMMYSIPSGLILGYISFSKNKTLSTGDKNAARLLYP